LIEAGEVKIHGGVENRPSYKVQSGDVLTLNVPPPIKWYPAPENIPLNIVYEDDDLIVLNKPAGLVVHPGAGNKDGTLVNALLYHCSDSLSGIGGVLRPGIVHRLDKDTSGLMVVAKNDTAHQGLAAQFSDRTLSRKYKALVLGVPMPPKGEINLPIARHHKNRLLMAVNEKHGKPARTFYKVVERYRDHFALVECTLESGRTHQIRVHMKAIDHPLIGDPAYGAQITKVQSALKKAGYNEDIQAHVLNFPRQALHAFSLTFIHPRSGKAMTFNDG
jgi:23S rRNA pseudouridine1911/1915/1917 synthase